MDDLDLSMADMFRQLSESDEEPEPVQNDIDWYDIEYVFEKRTQPDENMEPPKKRFGIPEFVSNTDSFEIFFRIAPVLMAILRGRICTPKFQIKHDEVVHFYHRRPSMKSKLILECSETGCKATDIFLCNQSTHHFDPNSGTNLKSNLFPLILEYPLSYRRFILSPEFWCCFSKAV